jgi:hypothetical protein
MTCPDCQWPTDNPAHVYGCRVNMPPLGIKPKVLWVEERLKDLDNAIVRYVGMNYDVPQEWIRERVEHVQYLNGVYNGE